MSCFLWAVGTFFIFVFFAELDPFLNKYTTYSDISVNFYTSGSCAWYWSSMIKNTWNNLRWNCFWSEYSGVRVPSTGFSTFLEVSHIIPRFHCVNYCFCYCFESNFLCFYCCYCWCDRDLIPYFLVLNHSCLYRCENTHQLSVVWGRDDAFVWVLYDVGLFRQIFSLCTSTLRFIWQQFV